VHVCFVDWIEDAKEAISLIDLARERVAHLGIEVIASVYLAGGICKSVLAGREQEPSTRGPIQRYPTPSAYFHAALTLPHPIPEQNLEKAIEYCRKAVEDEHMDVRHWHLLTLLEAKLGEWKKARGVLEASLDIADDVEARVYAEEMRDSGIVTRDYQTSASTNGNEWTDH